MPTLLERIAAKGAFWHASRVYARFQAGLHDVEQVQTQTLRQVLSLLGGSDYGRKYKLGAVRTVEDLKKNAPLVTYEDLRPYIDRMRIGDTGALLHPRERIHMFATSSGTTAKQKLIPVTPEFVRQYRRGWNIFGLKMLSDHPRAVLRSILQISGKYDESRTPAGVPCGAITGLLAKTQKRIVRRFYVGKPDLAYIEDARAKYYTLMRLAIVRDVAFAITANPATMIRMAQIADEESERLIRDVRDGVLSKEMVDDEPLRRRLMTLMSPNLSRARELEQLRSRRSALRPCDYWNLEFLACWTAGSMGYYLERLADWWGSLPVRDIGLLASEGRVTLPLDDATPAGVLDTKAAFFEFLPYAAWDNSSADTLAAWELEDGQDYTVVITNSAGLVRYRLDDVVRVRGWVGRTPLLEFLHRAGRVSSIAGEKLTEHHVIQAVRTATARLRLPEFDFIVAPHWADPPFYQLNCTAQPTAGLASTVDKALAEQNDEYRSRRKSFRLAKLQVVAVESEAIEALDRRLASNRGSTSEQYKRPCLLIKPGEDDNMFGRVI